MIDGDESFRVALAGNLSDDGHEVIAVELPIATPLPTRFAHARAVIADCNAGEAGFEFADLLHRAHPSLPIILTTARWSLHLEAEAGRRAFLSLLRKPFGYDALHTLLHQLAAAEAGR